ncbi:MAG: M3 family metallopeptidase [Planctomycetaceae bacterium]|nr:M3 family metallopeptidase [Planctomycetaceae bacterium]
MTDLTDNPLLQNPGLPRFDQITPEHIEPAVTQLIEASNTILNNLETNAVPEWDAIFGPLDQMDQLFEKTWKPVGHLLSVNNSPELRDAYEKVLPELVQFGLRVRQSQPVYQAVKAIRESNDWDSFSSARKRIVEQKLLSAKLSGIGLEAEQKDQFNRNSQKLSQLATEYSNHVLDATKAYSLIISKTDDTAGWPASLKNLTSQSYNTTREENDPESTPEKGPWKITLDGPIIQPFGQHCQNQELRKQTYCAYISRASQGDLDNTQLCNDILQLRKQQAQLLGYSDYGQMSLAEKMAPDVAAVLEMFDTLQNASTEPAKQDLIDIQQLAKENGIAEPLKHWDISFWTERLREQRYEVTDETLRQYFQHERVLQGLFDLINRLFGVEVRPADGETSVWDSTVRFFHVYDQDQLIAGFYYDPYSRPENKRGGAWMDDCQNRRNTDQGLQIPIAYLICNSTPPVGDQQALMTFREVETLFHEFGHGLHHMLSEVDEPDVSGVNGVEWDAVELPSQFMENWCYHKPTLLGMTAHIETGEPLPDDLFQKIVAARNYRAGSNTLRQLTLGMTDMLLHTEYDPQGKSSVFDVQRQVMEKTSVLPMLEEDRLLCSFQHIFAGGYAAGYYSYKWAEVLAADAFAAFEEAGLDNEQTIQQIGKKLRETIFANGGSKHPMELFKEFRGREPDPQALLKQCGLLK